MKDKISVALVNAINKNRRYAMNKDLNGGFGTADECGSSLSSKIISLIKWRSVKVPILSMAFLQALFKEKGYKVKYFESSLLSLTEEFDVILIYGSIVDYINENKIARILKKKFPQSKIGFFGSLPSRFPELFNGGDFVILGEAESFFMNDFENVNQLNGSVKVSFMTDLDALPNPDFDGFPIKEYGYFPCLPKKPFITLQASKGCPYSCRFYCAYGEYQGSKVRQRSPIKVVDDIVHVQKKHGIKSIQFRDPVFGLTKSFIPDFCNELKKRKIKIDWGMETRLDLLNEDNIKMMFNVGLRNINVGVETKVHEIAKKNKRLLINEPHQEKIIRYCNKIGVKIAAFYILGYEGDTVDTIKETLNYSRKINSFVSRFSISTPFPGTGFYTQLNDQNRILTKNFELFTLNNLVYQHPNLSSKQAKELLEEAFRKYYFRPIYFLRLLKWKIREFWL